jgi:hypothetical protein
VGYRSTEQHRLKEGRLQINERTHKTTSRTHTSLEFERNECAIVSFSFPESNSQTRTIRARFSCAAEEAIDAVSGLCVCVVVVGVSGCFGPCSKMTTRPAGQLFGLLAVGVPFVFLSSGPAVWKRLRLLRHPLMTQRGKRDVPHALGKTTTTVFA